MSSNSPGTGKIELSNGQFVLRVSANRLAAIISPKDPENGANLEGMNIKTLMEEVRSHGVSFGLVEVPASVGNGSFLVAKGRPAVDGEKAKVMPCFKLNDILPSETEDSENRVIDLRELDTIINVPKGKLLLKKIPPTDGTPGRTVTNEIIKPKPGKDINMRVGSGASLSEDGLEVISEVEGEYKLSEGRVTVEVEHNVSGDVDTSIGNISFVGERLVVNGAVLPGFKVKGKNDVYIGQGVQNSAEIDAGRNLGIKGGVVGDGVVIKCWGNIEADFIENVGRIEVKCDLLVSQALIQAHTRVGNNLKMLTGKGVLVGGKHDVSGSAYVREIGSEAEVVTEVIVGSEPELKERVKEFKEEKKHLADKMNEIMESITALQELEKRSGDKFPPERAVLLKKNSEVLLKLQEKANSLTETKKALDAEVDQTLNKSVHVYGAAFPGTKITIGSVSRILIKREEQVVIHLDKLTRRIRCRSMTLKEQKVFN